MNEVFVERIKSSLIKEREAIRKSLDSQMNDMKRLIKTQEAGDAADVASDAIDRTLLDSLSAQDAERLQQIDGALNRIRQGRYGICIKCGKDIPEARLQAIPYAVMCVQCASRG